MKIHEKRIRKCAGYTDIFEDLEGKPYFAAGHISLDLQIYTVHSQLRYVDKGVNLNEPIGFLFSGSHGRFSKQGQESPEDRKYIRYEELCRELPAIQENVR